MRRVLASWRVSARRNPTFHKVSTSDSGVQSSSQVSVPWVGSSRVISSRHNSSMSSRLKIEFFPRNASRTLSRPGYWNRYSAAISLVRSREWG